MKSYSEMEYNNTAEKLVDILCIKTENNNPLFFRVLVGYYFSLVASMMRCSVAMHDGRDIPINMYALNLAPSGYGKGRATNIIENEVTHLFKKVFTKQTFPSLAQINLTKLAIERANTKGTDIADEEASVDKEYKRTGTLMFSFAAATLPAVKQHRQKLLMANAGALNLVIDEIGDNLNGSMEIFPAFFELYDVGAVKDKLVMETNDRSRFEEVAGNTPTNLMMFGSPAPLLDGDKTEQTLRKMFESGLARRAFCTFMRNAPMPSTLTPEEIYEQSINPTSTLYLEELADRLESLADMVNINKRLVISKETSLLLIEYRQKCERQAAEFNENHNSKRYEMNHRYFKAMKLAGAYAFIDQSAELTSDHLYSAIKVAEDCGESFNELLTTDHAHVKLAKYIAMTKGEVNQSDLVADLPFYKGSSAVKADMLTLAIAWGYKNNIIIKKSFDDGIEQLRGETLKASDLDKMVISYSRQLGYEYEAEYAPFDKLWQLTQMQGMHWSNHHMAGGHRSEDTSIPGFNFMVLDVDGSTQISTAKMLLSKYKAMYYTTKRSTDEVNRFRILLPINYQLVMDAKDYKEFYNNVVEWLPFAVDETTNQRSKKWLANAGHYEYTEGEIFNALPFIPKTTKNAERKTLYESQQSMDNLERWVINNIGDGNRNNLLLRYAMILIDAGFSEIDVSNKVKALNEKIADKLSEAELLSTILITVTRTIAKRGIQ